MAKQTINIGSAANDGTGEAIRSAFDKINQNTDELYDGMAAAAVGPAAATDGNVAVFNGATGKLIEDGGDPQTLVGNTGWTAWTPTISALTGTITTMGTVTARYRKIGTKTVQFNIEANITTNGTGASYFQFTLPLNKAASSGRAVFIGQELLKTGKFVGGFVAAGNNIVGVRTYDNAYPGSDGAQIVMGGVYEI